MKNVLYWNGRPIPYVSGETLAYTLLRATPCREGFGNSCTAQVFGLFCGMGACQGCLVEVQGQGRVEACLTPSQEDMQVRSICDAVINPQDVCGLNNVN